MIDASSETVGGASSPRLRRRALLLVAAIIAGALAWWLVGRVTAGSRTLRVRRLPETLAEGPESGLGSESRLRVLAWNIAHGRGAESRGWRRNWAGGGREAKLARLVRIARVLRESGAELVVLNEVDFDAPWSGGVNQAALLARIAGYPTWVEQRNFDVTLPFVDLSFGNAVLSRARIVEARPVELPVHSRLEKLALGAKSSALVVVEPRRGERVGVVAVHLDFREEATRMRAVPVLEDLREREAAPLILAGDFNSAPPGWPGAGDTTTVGTLLEGVWSSDRPSGPPSPEEWTFPTLAPERALDWILVEPPLRVTGSRVLRAGPDLSDHAPVISTVELPVSVE